MPRRQNLPGERKDCRPRLPRLQTKPLFQLCLFDITNGPWVASRYPSRTDFRGIAVSSIASPIHATNAVASLTQQQVPGSAPDTGDTGSDPFAALLEAAAAPTNTHSAVAEAATSGAAGNSNTPSTGTASGANAIATPTTKTTKATTTTTSVGSATNATVSTQPAPAKTKTSVAAAVSKLNELAASASL